MANGTGYFFSHDYNARTDEKTKALIRKHGMLGYGIFWAIVEDLYNNANALRLDYEGIAYDYRCNVDVIKSVILDFNLFVIEDDYFGSNSVQRRLDEREERSLKASKSARKRWDNANAMQTHSDSNAIKERKGKEIKGEEKKGDEAPPPPKIDIPISDEPKPPPKKSPPVAATPPIGEVSIEDCVRWYKSQAYEGTRQTVCMAKYIDMETLLDWVDAFGLKLTGEGEVRKSVGDFASHFFRWMKYQKTDVNPKTLIHEQKESNGQATNNNRNNKNATGAKVLNADYKADLLRRMAGDTSQSGNGGG